MVNKVNTGISNTLILNAFFQYCNRYDGNHTFDQNLRVGLVRELILQVTVTNKANDHAYYPKLLVKYPRSLGYLRTGDVSRLKDN